MKYAPDELKQRWYDGDERKTQIWNLVLTVQNATKTERSDVRLRAIQWLSKRVTDIFWTEQQTLKREMELRKQDDDDPNVKQAADQVLTRLQEIERRTTIERWDKEMNTGDDDSRAKVIKQVAENETLSAQRFLVRRWVEWIAKGDKQSLVEVASDAMFFRSSAVLPLAEQLIEGSKPVAQSDVAPLDQDIIRSQLAIRGRVSRQLADMSDQQVL